jgi:hypothetical protein
VQDFNQLLAILRFAQQQMEDEERAILASLGLPDPYGSEQ